MLESEKHSFANPEVLKFYTALPFNHYSSIEKQAESITNSKGALAANVPILPFLDKNIRVVDIGCGPGLFANLMAYNHPTLDVTGVDFNPVAIERAESVARYLSISTKFETADLFSFSPSKRFDLVVSIGVLHHTNNCLAAIEHLIANTMTPDGHIYIGLYHTYGRRPFLRYFENLKTKGASEAELYTNYKKLHSNLSDETHLKSWFRDQVLHPHETQHTLREICQLFDNFGVELLSTSINRFQSFPDRTKLFELEENYENLGKEVLADGRYFPGFFTLLGRKPTN